MIVILVRCRRIWLGANVIFGHISLSPPARPLLRRLFPSKHTHTHTADSRTQTNESSFENSFSIKRMFALPFRIEIPAQRAHICLGQCERRRCIWFCVFFLSLFVSLFIVCPNSIEFDVVLSCLSLRINPCKGCSAHTQWSAWRRRWKKTNWNYFLGKMISIPSEKRAFDAIEFEKSFGWYRQQQHHHHRASIGWVVESWNAAKW